jgi:outer membrane protein, heavy metal efflux system
MLIRRTASIIAAGLALAAGGCASTLAARDLERVRALGAVPALPDLRKPTVDSTTPSDVQKLLAEPLDAERAVRIALLNNRDLRASLREMGIARGRLAQARALPNPTLEFEKPVEPEIRYEVGVEYDLTEALLAPMRSGAAAADVEAGRYRAAAVMVETGFSVRSAFYSAQAAEQRLALGRQSLDALAAGRDAARALAAAGNIAKLALATHEAAYERSRVLVAGMELEWAAARERLNRLLGLHGGETAWTIRGQLPPPPAQSPAATALEGRAIEASLRLGELRSRLDGLARRTGVSRAEGWIPDVSLGFRAAEMAPEQDSHGRRRYGVGVTVTVPLFDRKSATTAALGAEFDGLLERYHGAAVEVRSLARESHDRLVSAHGRARQYQNLILPAQRQVTRETTLQFNAMQLGVFQLLLARREELDAELGYVETLREYWTARAAMEAVLQGGTPAGETSSDRSATLTTNNSAGGH